VDSGNHLFWTKSCIHERCARHLRFDFPGESFKEASDWPSKSRFSRSGFSFFLINLQCHSIWPLMLDLTGAIFYNVGDAKRALAKCKLCAYSLSCLVSRSARRCYNRLEPRFRSGGGIQSTAPALPDVSKHVRVIRNGRIRAFHAVLAGNCQTTASSGNCGNY